MSSSQLNTSGLTAYCPNCFSCLEPRVALCAECNAPRPDPTWPSLYDCPYPYLGRLVEGRYIIDRFLDSGATGHVYRARSLRFARHFAIKIVDTRRYSDPARRQEIVQRFRREVETMSHIKNPHAVGVYEAITLADGVLGLVMDFVDGQTLGDFLKDQGRLEIDEALTLVRQIANGLHEAHRNGIIHRDVKPDNVMVEKLPASGYFARILDFGIAQIVGSTSQTYGFRGTPLYASPEQCLGNGSLDARSDIYSLGCLLFHLLTGRPPFPYTNALQVMDGHIDAPRPRLNDVLDDVDFPDELENLLAHMLARIPDDRPADLHTIHQDLTLFLKKKPLRHFGHPPEYVLLQEITEASAPPEDLWAAQLTPPSSEFISLHERISTELASDPTFSEAAEDLFLQDHPSVQLKPILDLTMPPSPAGDSSITAAVLDRRGLACVVADHTPAIHFLEINESSKTNQAGFQFTFAQSNLISAVEIDLSQGIFLSVDVRGVLRSTSPGSGHSRKLAQLPGVPLTLDLIPAAQQIYFGTERGILFLYDLRTDTCRELTRFPHAISTIFAAQHSPTLVGLWDGSVAQVGMDACLTWHIPVAPDTISYLGYLDDRSYFALDHRGTLHIGDSARGDILQTFYVGPGLRTLRRLDDGRLMTLSILHDRLRVMQLLIDLG